MKVDPTTNDTSEMGTVLSREAWRARIGQRLGASDWHEITQERIDTYGHCVGDTYWIHCDPARAAKESPTGTTIAHGLLTLSLVSAMSYEALPRLAGERMVYNYGLNRLRYVSPVPVGSRLRGLFDLEAIDERVPGEWTITCTVTIEIEGQDRPALAAEWLHRRYFTEPDPQGAAE